MLSKILRSRIKNLSCQLTWLKLLSMMQANIIIAPGDPAQLEKFLVACSKPFLILQGKQVHTQVIVNGYYTNDTLASRLLGMYVICDRFSHSKNIFYDVILKISSKAMPWNWMIRGCNKLGWFEFGVLFYFKMQGMGVCPDKYTFPPLIKACCGLKSVRLGRMVHENIVEMGFDIDEFVGSALLKLYAENGCLDDADRLFWKMTKRDCVLWNVMLHALAKSEEPDKCLKMFQVMRKSANKLNSATFSCILSVCRGTEMNFFITQLHGLVVRYGLDSDPSVTNTLVSSYAKGSMLVDAAKLFESINPTSVVSWNAMVCGFVQNGFVDNALSLFRNMISAGVKPDETTLSSLVPSLPESVNLRQSKLVHSYIIRHEIIQDVFLVSALIDMYGKYGNMETARKIFDNSAGTDIVACTAMISGFVLNGMYEDGLNFFKWLLEREMTPNALTLSSVLPSFSGLSILRTGKELHVYILKNGFSANCHVGSALLNMYAKCGRLDLAHNAFKKLSRRDSICWNAMITSCSQNGKPELVMSLLREMAAEGNQYNCVTISASLSASASLPCIRYGKEIHNYMIKNNFSGDVYSESALIDMYAKCGMLWKARLVFDMMENKYTVAWNSIIDAYGYHGLLEESLSLFNGMLENGIHPDAVSFISIISACGHGGYVDDGIKYFRFMTEKYGLSPRVEHYACLVDLLARAGRLDEAFETINSMPCTPDAGIWGTLLGSCRVHGNVELAELASTKLVQLQATNSGYSMLLSNTRASAGQWSDALEIRSMMKEDKIHKVPGYSWIEVDSNVNIFVSSDKSHPLSIQIHFLLRNLLAELKREDYFYHPSCLVSI